MKTTNIICVIRRRQRVHNIRLPQGIIIPVVLIIHDSFTMYIWAHANNFNSNHDAHLEKNIVLYLFLCGVYILWRQTLEAIACGFKFDRCCLCFFVKYLFVLRQWWLLYPCFDYLPIMSVLFTHRCKYNGIWCECHTVLGWCKLPTNTIHHYTIHHTPLHHTPCTITPYTLHFSTIHLTHYTIHHYPLYLHDPKLPIMQLNFKY